MILLLYKYIFHPFIIIFLFTIVSLTAEILSYTTQTALDIYQKKNKNKTADLIIHWSGLELQLYPTGVHCCLSRFSALEIVWWFTKNKKLLLSILQRDAMEDHLSTIVLTPLWMVWQATKVLTSQSHHPLANREVLASLYLHRYMKTHFLHKPRDVQIPL